MPANSRWDLIRALKGYCSMRLGQWVELIVVDFANFASWANYRENTYHKCRVEAGRT